MTSIFSQSLWVWKKKNDINEILKCLACITAWTQQYKEPWRENTVFGREIVQFRYVGFEMPIQNSGLGIGRFSSVQSLSRVRLFATPWTAARQASLSITISRSSLRLTSIESVMPSSHLILCAPFSSCPQSFPGSVSFPMSQFFTSRGQSIGASASVLPVKIQGWFPLGLTSLILLSKELSGVFSSTIVRKHSSVLSLLYGPNLTSVHDIGKTIALTISVWGFYSAGNKKPGKVFNKSEQCMSRLYIVTLLI